MSLLTETVAATRPASADAMAAAQTQEAIEGASAAPVQLDLTPLLDLGMCLGESSGAALAAPLVQACARILQEVATFDSAGVTDKA